MAEKKEAQNINTEALLEAMDKFVDKKSSTRTSDSRATTEAIKGMSKNFKQLAEAFNRRQKEVDKANTQSDNSKVNASTKKELEKTTRALREAAELMAKNAAKGKASGVYGAAKDIYSHAKSKDSGKRKVAEEALKGWGGGLASKGTQRGGFLGSVTSALGKSMGLLGRSLGPLHTAVKVATAVGKVVMAADNRATKLTRNYIAMSGAQLRGADIRTNTKSFWAPSLRAGITAGLDTDEVTSLVKSLVDSTGKNLEGLSASTGYAGQEGLGAAQAVSSVSAAAHLLGVQTDTMASSIGSLMMYTNESLAAMTRSTLVMGYQAKKSQIPVERFMGNVMKISSELGPWASNLQMHGKLLSGMKSSRMTLDQSADIAAKISTFAANQNMADFASTLALAGFGSQAGIEGLLDKVILNLESKKAVADDTDKDGIQLQIDHFRRLRQDPTMAVKAMQDKDFKSLVTPELLEGIFKSADFLSGNYELLETLTGLPQEFFKRAEEAEMTVAGMFSKLGLSDMDSDSRKAWAKTVLDAGKAVTNGEFASEGQKLALSELATATGVHEDKLSSILLNKDFASAVAKAADTGSSEGLQEMFIKALTALDPSMQADISSNFLDPDKVAKATTPLGKYASTMSEYVKNMASLSSPATTAADISKEIALNTGLMVELLARGFNLTDKLPESMTNLSSALASAAQKKQEELLVNQQSAASDKKMSREQILIKQAVVASKHGEVDKASELLHEATLSKNARTVLAPASISGINLSGADGDPASIKLSSSLPDDLLLQSSPQYDKIGKAPMTVNNYYTSKTSTPAGGLNTTNPNPNMPSKVKVGG